jgi:hypothetical protein
VSEVNSVNGKAGAVVLAATDVEAVPESEVGQPDGVATLDVSGKLPEAQLPSSVVSSSRKARSEVSGVVAVNFAEGTPPYTAFPYKLTGATTFKPENLPSFRENGFLVVEPNGHTFSIEGISWINSEPTFKTTGKYAIGVFIEEGVLYGYVAGEGPEGKEGPAGISILSGSGSPAESLGVVGQVYVETASGLPVRWYIKTLGGWGAGTQAEGPRGPEGPVSALGIIGLVLPVSGAPFQPTNSVAFTAKKARFRMMTIPKEGKKLTIYIANGATAKGNIRVGAFDTGQASSGSYTLLVQTGEEAQTGTAKWQAFALPEHTFTSGQLVMIGVMNSSSEGTYYETAGPGANALCELPGGLTGPLVTTPKLIATHSFAAVEFITLTTAEMEASSTAPIAMYGHIA